MEDTNGVVRWRDLDARLQTLRQEHDASLRRLEDQTRETCSTQSKALESVVTRVRAVESVIDQQRGARNLVYALIGSNLLLVGVSLLTILHLVGII